MNTKPPLIFSYTALPLIHQWQMQNFPAHVPPGRSVTYTSPEYKNRGLHFSHFSLLQYPPRLCEVSVHIIFIDSPVLPFLILYQDGQENHLWQDRLSFLHFFHTLVLRGMRKSCSWVHTHQHAKHYFCRNKCMCIDTQIVYKYPHQLTTVPPLGLY